MTQTFASYSDRLGEFIRRAFRLPEGLPSAECNEEFDELALALFALQHEHNPAYRNLCAARGVKAASVRCWTQIPPAPTAAFKELELTSLPASARTTVFHSSGTAGQRPSRHFHDQNSLAVYEASLRPWFQRHLLPELFPPHEAAPGSAGIPAGESAQHVGRDADAPSLRRFMDPMRDSDIVEALHELPVCCPGLSPPDIAGQAEAWTTSRRFQFISLTPTADAAPHSSLVHMFDSLHRASGSADSFFAGRATAAGVWTLDSRKLLTALGDASRPLVLLGTAFTFVGLLDDLAARSLHLRLPAGSRALETGGYKGRSRSLPKHELHGLITDRLGIAPDYIVCEYGMSELSSQAYDNVAGSTRSAGPKSGNFHFPPWARAQIISPETGREVADGETGLIRVFDLANVFSVMAVQTEDLSVRRGDGFGLLGRAVIAEPRGCSLLAV